MSLPSILAGASPTLLDVIKGIDAQKGGGAPTGSLPVGIAAPGPPMPAVPPMLSAKNAQPPIPYANLSAPQGPPTVPMMGAVGTVPGPSRAAVVGAVANAVGQMAYPSSRVSDPSPNSPSLFAQPSGTRPLDVPDAPDPSAAPASPGDPASAPMSAPALAPTVPGSAPAGAPMTRADMMRAQAAGLFSQAQAIPGAQAPHLAFGLPDALALGASLFAGRQAGNVLGGYLQGKEQYAGQQAQTATQNNELQRQALLQQAQGLQQAANTEDVIQGRTDVQGAKNAGNLAVTQAKVASAEQIAAARDATRRAMNQSTLAVKGAAPYIAALAKASPEVRVTLMNRLANGDPNLGQVRDQDPEAFDAAARALTAQDAQGFQNASLLASRGGWYDQQTLDAQTLTPAKLEEFLARADAARSQSFASLQAGGVSATRSDLLQKQIDRFDVDDRAKVAEIYSRINKEQRPGGNLGDQRSAITSLLQYSRKQINTLRALNHGQPPDASSDPQGAASYTTMQGIEDQATTALAAIANGQAPHVNATVSAYRGNPAPDAPNALVNQLLGGLPGVAAGAATPNQGEGTTVLAGGPFGGNPATAQGMPQTAVQAAPYAYSGPKLFGQTPRNADEGQVFQQAQAQVARIYASPAPNAAKAAAMKSVYSTLAATLKQMRGVR